MKRYTLRALIHDAKVFNQLRWNIARPKRSAVNLPRPSGCTVTWLAKGDACELERMKKSNVQV